MDDDVVKYINEHFIAVITDHPKGNTEPKRNPRMWERVESWKERPSNAQLVWLVSADDKQRDGIYYNKYKDPDKLLAWLKSVVEKKP